MSGRGLVPFRSFTFVEREDLRDPFVAFRREIDRLFDEFTRGWSTVFGAPATALLPELDVTEDDRAYHVTVELPGVDPRDVSVELRGDVLVIRGEKRDEHEEKGENRHRIERRFGRFERMIRLPAEIESDRAEAVFDKGVLRITLPKPEAAQQPVRRIEVKAA